MAYLDAFFHECLRIKPHFDFFVTRQSVKETTVNGYHIPKGVKIFMPAFGVNWSEEHWPEPLKFDPDRLEKLFITGCAKKTALLPFFCHFLEKNFFSTFFQKHHF